jgi:hypothetical protein
LVRARHLATSGLAQPLENTNPLSSAVVPRPGHVVLAIR